MRPWLLLSCACLALSACASLPIDSDDPSLRRQALLDAYLIAHGMAVSYVRSGHANPEVVGQLAQLDARARELASNPRTDESSTADAVAALTSYAAKQAGGS